MYGLIKKVLNRIKRMFAEIFEISKYKIAGYIAKIKYKNRRIFLISERGYDARDNGYHMFKHFREHHPEYEVYYIIDKKSADYDKVRNLGATIQRRSWNHYLLFAYDSCKISTHIMGCSPNIPIFSAYHAKHRISGKHIFLQHGVIKDCLIGLFSENCNLDVFICGAKPEYEYVLKEFNYSHGEVRYTGLARYDNLQSYETKKQILVMPTWRAYLNTLNERGIIESEYFKAWNQLLNDKELISVLTEQNYSLLFYPHYELQKFAHLFKSSSSNIVIADFEHYDVQQLLKESELLITDFSSVFFDFAYMKKPVIYYQFDEQTFFSKHYLKGYFDYRTMGFGPVVNDHQEAIDMIKLSIENQNILNEMYSKRSESFFSLHDNHNCERIFKEVMKLYEA